MNHIWIKIIFWVAFLCYAIPGLIYTSKLAYYIEINDILQLLSYSILSCAFLAFSVYTFENALDKSIHDKELANTVSLYKSPARLGYALMTLSFLITIAVSYRKGEPLYFQRVIAITAYLCLALKIDAGIFLVIAFYCLSLWLAVRVNFTDKIYAASKAGLIVYYATYAYIVIQEKLGKKIKAP